MRAVHVFLCGAKLNETAALQTYTFVKLIVPAADIKSFIVKS